MFNLSSSTMQGMTSTYLDKTNYIIRFDINLVYAYLRSYRDFDFSGLLDALKIFEQEYIASFGQTDISEVIPVFSAFKWKTSSGTTVGVPIAIPFGIDNENKRFNIYMIGNNLSGADLDNYVTNK